VRPPHLGPQFGDEEEKPGSRQLHMAIEMGRHYAARAKKVPIEEMRAQRIAAHPVWTVQDRPGREIGPYDEEKIQKRLKEYEDRVGETAPSHMIWYEHVPTKTTSLWDLHAYREHPPMRWGTRTKGYPARGEDPRFPYEGPRSEL